MQIDKNNNFELKNGIVEMTPDDFRFVSDKIQEETAKSIIGDYMEVLDSISLPEEVWLAIADVNGKYLNEPTNTTK